jgi:hypothetical protein
VHNQLCDLAGSGWQALLLSRLGFFSPLLRLAEADPVERLNLAGESTANCDPWLQNTWTCMPEVYSARHNKHV